MSVIAITLMVMLAGSLPKVPRAFVNYARLPVLNRLPQPEAYGTDTIADTYEAKVILNDVSDMYTKRRLDQTPLEAQTWSEEASAPYPPAVLLAEAGLHAVGERLGIGLYGMVLLLAVAFIGMSLWYCLQTRWYLFPLLYLNFGYFSERFVHVQDGSYLVMLCVVMAALLLARARRPGPHALIALAITMKVSPLFYVTELLRMRRRDAAVFVAILAAGLLLPYFVWDNYLYIFTFNDGLKGRWYSGFIAAAIAVPFALALWRAEERQHFDLEDRIGWALVPFALFLAFKMNVARHLLIVLLVPDKRGLRTLAAAVALFVPAIAPHLVRFNSALPIAAGLLVGIVVWYLGFGERQVSTREPRVGETGS
ncbi:MAG: hypothetical protein ABI634_09270 [Acidobacteriota bacterium]